MPKPIRLHRFALLLALWLFLPARAAADPTGLPMPPSDIPFRLERWQKGWRIDPGQAPGAVFPQVAPDGRLAMLLYQIPGGRATLRGTEANLYLADLSNGRVRPVAAPGVVSWSRWSPGGRWFSFGVGDTVDADLWLFDAREQTLTLAGRQAAAGHRWLDADLVLYWDAGKVTGFDPSRQRRIHLAGPGEEFRGLLGGGQSVVTRGRSRQVFLLPTGTSAPAVPISPTEAFVNAAAVAEGGARLVYLFTRTRGVPGGANTLYVESLGVHTAFGQGWEMALGFRGDLREHHLHLSPDGRFLLIDYTNGTDEPAPYSGPSGCAARRITPGGRSEPWVPGVATFQLAGEGWAWKNGDAWWFRRPGLPTRRLLLRDLPPGLDPDDPPHFEAPSGVVKVRPAGGRVEYLLPTEPTSFSVTGEAEERLSTAVGREWRRIPVRLTMEARLKQLADTLGRVHRTYLADTDHDGLPDLTIAYGANWDRPMEVRLAPMLLFRGADLAAGRVRGHRLERSALFPRVEQLTDVTGDGRPELIVMTEPTGSGAVSDWLVYQWTGSRYSLIFQHALDHWRGDNQIRFEPGRITFTCRPLRAYEHKHDPHRQALSLFRQALTLPPEPESAPPGWKDREWRPFVHLRLGQSLALLGRVEEAKAALEAAARAGTHAGQAAALFLEHLPTGVPEAMAALLRTHLHAVDLAPPAVTLQAYLQRNAERAVPDLLAATGFAAQPHFRVDLNADGHEEVWSMIGYNSLLGVQTPQGWRVGALDDWSHAPEIIPLPYGRGNLIQIGPTEPLIGWNGHTVQRVSLYDVHESPLLPSPAPRCKEGDQAVRKD